MPLFLFFSSMTKKLFVGNISWGVSDDALKDLFAQYGEVEDAAILKDRDTNRSRGFGFVTFTDDTAADKAIAELDGYELDGRALVVNEARPRENRRSF